MSCSQRLLEKLLSCCRVTCWAEQELEGVSKGVHRSIVVYPDLFHLHICLIDALGIGCSLEMGSASPLQFRSIALHPAVDRRLVNV